MFMKKLILEGTNLKSKTYFALKCGRMSGIKQVQCHELRKTASFVRRALLINFELPILIALIRRSICLSAVNYQEPNASQLSAREILLAVLSILLQDMSHQKFNFVRSSRIFIELCQVDLF